MPSVLTHPLGSSRFANLLRMVGRYGCEPRYLPRLLGVGLQSLLRQPCITYEALRYRKRIEAQAIQESPVFVIGHWRSGTTHLQNILSHDPQFASVTIRQASMPLDFLTLGKWIARAFEKSIPEKRLMDDVAVAADSPWEEELALVSTSPLSFYHVSFFPKAVERIFRDSILFDGGDPELVEQWKRDYLWFLKKVALARPGKTFLLKNPANTARIELLLQQFPDARFIHIRRDPFQVFRSTVHLYLQAQSEWGFHQADRAAIVEHVLASYPLLMDAYFRQRGAIPDGRLAEVRFEDLEARPMETLEAAYADAGLDGFAQAAPRFQVYLDSIRGYRKNPHELPADETALVRDRWADWFQRLGYQK